MVCGRRLTTRSTVALAFWACAAFASSAMAAQTPRPSRTPSASPRVSPARASTKKSNRSSRPQALSHDGSREELTMGKVAFVFPGQASQYPGMGKELAEKYPSARAVFDEADKALGFSISKMCFAGTEEDLKLTANTQPAILTCSVAAFRVAAEKGLQPDFVAGHSLGEYSALVAAGGLKFSDAVQLVRKRGQYMQEAVPPGVGAMAAIMGLSPAVVADACKRAAEGEVCF